MCISNCEGKHEHIWTPTPAPPTLEHHIITGRDSNDFLLRPRILKPRNSEESPEYGVITTIHIDSEKSDVTLLHADSRLTAGHEVAEIIK